MRFAITATLTTAAWLTVIACDEGARQSERPSQMPQGPEALIASATPSELVAPVNPTLLTEDTPARAPSPNDAGTQIADAAPTMAARRPGAYANLDPNDDYVVGPPDAWPDCEIELKNAGISYRRATLPVYTQKKSKIVCGAPEVVIYLGGPSKISYNAQPLVTCGMALALASFERVVQEEAQRAFHSRVTRFEQMGTYSCREVAAYPGTVSEHSYANAIDLMRFTLQSGKVVDVLHDFDMSPETPKKPEGIFLRAISQRANDEDIFSHVLTGFFNDVHKNHFHLDLARFRQDGTRPE